MRNLVSEQGNYLVVGYLIGGGSRVLSQRIKEDSANRDANLFRRHLVDYERIEVEYANACHDGDFVDEYGPNCRHCKTKPVQRPRGLCWSCYRDDGIRNQYPSQSKYASGGGGWKP